MINEAEGMAEQPSGALGIMFVQKAYAYLLPNGAKISSSLRGRSRRTSTVVAFQFRYRRWRLDSLEVERRSVVEKYMLPMAWSLQTAPDKGPLLEIPDIVKMLLSAARDICQEDCYGWYSV